MKTALIACKTLEDEVNEALKNTDHSFSVYWIESGLHNYPDKLRENLQQCIDEIADCDYIVMAFGLCGNALLNLSSKSATLVIPKVDDCISLFLGGNDQRRQMESSAKSYYLTSGWLRYENNIWKEYLRSLEKYGPEKTKYIFGLMLKHYNYLTIIDTGAYDAGEFKKEAEKIAEALGLTLRVVLADLSLLQKSLFNNWGFDFAMIPPGRKVSLQDMNNCMNYLGPDSATGLNG